MSLMAMKVYSAEFWVEAVALYLSYPRHTFEGIGNDLGVSRETLRNRVRAERKRTGASHGRAPGQRGGAAGVPAGEYMRVRVGGTRQGGWDAQIQKLEAERRSCARPRNISRARRAPRGAGLVERW